MNEGDHTARLSAVAIGQRFEAELARFQDLSVLPQMSVEELYTLLRAIRTASDVLGMAGQDHRFFRNGRTNAAGNKMYALWGVASSYRDLLMAEIRGRSARDANEADLIAEIAVLDAVYAGDEIEDVAKIAVSAAQIVEAMRVAP